MSKSLAVISGPYFIKLVRLPVLSILSPGPGFYLFASGSGFYQTSPGPDVIYFESGSDLIKAVRKASPVPDYINV